MSKLESFGPKFGSTSLGPINSEGGKLLVILFRIYITSSGQIGDFAIPIGIIRVWGPLEWVGDELNGYFLVRLKGLCRIFQKIYNSPWSTKLVVPTL